MIQYLFVKIPSLLFEPIAAGAFLGYISAFWYYRKKHNRFFGVITTTISIMFLWRLLGYSLMTSSRYASILLYPSIIFVVWFCFNFRNIICSVIPQHAISSTKTRKRLIPLLLIAGLTIASIIKAANYTPYGNCTTNVCKELSQKISGKEFLLYSYTNQGEQERIAYYTGIDYKTIHFLNDDASLSLYELLKKKMDDTKNFFHEVYFIFYLKKGDPKPNAQYLNVVSELGKWECVHREFTSRRKNKELVLYQFSPAHANIEIWENEIPDISPDNLCENGDFENYLTDRKLEQRIAYYKDAGTSSFYWSPERLFPTQWWFGVAKPQNGKSPEVSLTNEDPIAGQLSFELNSNGSFDWGTNSAFIPKQNCFFSGFIQAKTDAVVKASSCYWDTDKEKIGYIKNYEFHLNHGSIYRFSFPVQKIDVPEEDKSIFLIIKGTGHILLDNVEFIKNCNQQHNENKLP